MSPSSGGDGTPTGEPSSLPTALSRTAQPPPPRGLHRPHTGVCVDGCLSCSSPTFLLFPKPPPQRHVLLPQAMHRPPPPPPHPPPHPSLPPFWSFPATSKQARVRRCHILHPRFPTPEAPHSFSRPRTHHGCRSLASAALASQRPPETEGGGRDKSSCPQPDPLPGVAVPSRAHCALFPLRRTSCHFPSLRKPCFQRSCVVS